jgi:hypothetical protein
MRSKRHVEAPQTLKDDLPDDTYHFADHYLSDDDVTPGVSGVMRRCT